MYPAPFRYHRPATLDEAMALLSDLGEGARPLAGGQSLIPILKLRMDEPTDLVDIARIPGMRHIDGDGQVIRIGALATHARIAASEIAARAPIVQDCASGIADPQVRARGTIGGSVSTADPSCDWPTMLHVLDAQVVCRGASGERTVGIRDFFVDAYTTALREGELVTGIRFTPPPGGSGGAYITFKKAAPAYPAASVGVQLNLADGDLCREARLVLGCAGPRPVISREAEQELEGRTLNDDALQRAAEALISCSDPPSDSRGSAAFKRTMLHRLFMKAAGIAVRRARGETVKGGPLYV